MTICCQGFRLGEGDSLSVKRPGTTIAQKIKQHFDENHKPCANRFQVRKCVKFRKSGTGMWRWARTSVATPFMRNNASFGDPRKIGGSASFFEVTKWDETAAFGHPKQPWPWPPWTAASPVGCQHSQKNAKAIWSTSELFVYDVCLQ